MGITKFSYDTLQNHGGIKAGDKMLELGDQNMYFDTLYGQFAKPHFVGLGIDHISVDLSAHEGGAVEMDLTKPFNKPEWKKHFDVITDFGTSEHCADSLYHVFKNIHDSLKVGGLMFHENPKTGNWPGHGAHYFTKEFYQALASLCFYDLLEVGEHPAMGNTTDGWNVYAVIRKTTDNDFIDEKLFNQLGFKQS